MGDRSRIAWTDATWNPVTGCDKVSAGCDHCYAETIAHRFAGTPAYPHGFAVTLRPERLDQPLRWRRPRRVFVNSTSDLFHAHVDDTYLNRVFDVMARADQHIFQILTKRPGRMRAYLRARAAPPRAPLPPHIWMGVSVETQHWADVRIPLLQDIPAAVRFLSCEPLLGPLVLCRCDGATHEPQRHPFLVHPDCPLHGPRPIHWVIVGGESGPRARRMDPAWALRLADECTAGQVACFFKQTGTVLAAERRLTGKGEDPAEWPWVLPREYPSQPPTTGLDRSPTAHAPHATPASQEGPT